jgi:predicted DNA-binding transcriptional regulator AlpA
MPTLADDRQLELPGVDCERFVRFNELKPDHGIPFSRTSLAEMEAHGRLPRRVRLSPNTIAWRLSDLERWKAATVEQAQARGAEPLEAALATPGSLPVSSAPRTVRAARILPDAPARRAGARGARVRE